MAISKLQVSSGGTKQVKLGASSKKEPSPLAALSDPTKKKDYKKKGAAPVDDFGGTDFGGTNYATPGLLGDGK